MRRLSLLAAVVALVMVAAASAPANSGRGTGTAWGGQAIANATAAGAVGVGPQGGGSGPGVGGAAGGASAAEPAQPAGNGRPVAPLASPFDAEPGEEACEPQSNLELQAEVVEPSNPTPRPVEGGVLAPRVILQLLEVSDEGVTQPAAGTSFEFEREPLEPRGSWTLINAKTTEPSIQFNTNAVKAGKRVTPDGLYNLRVRVHGVAGCGEAELTDQLLDDQEAPVFVLELKPPDDIHGVLTLEARENEKVPTSGTAFPPWASNTPNRAAKTGSRLTGATKRPRAANTWRPSRRSTPPTSV